MKITKVINIYFVINGPHNNNKLTLKIILISNCNNFNHTQGKYKSYEAFIQKPQTSFLM